MIIKKILLKNYGSYKELELPVKPGMHLVVGPNGSGKSTVFESIIETLYKARLRGKDPSKDLNGNCTATVVFDKMQSTYEVTRTWGKVNNLKIIRDGEDISDRRRIDRDTQLREIIEVSEEIFKVAIVVVQGMPVKFGLMTPTSLKSSLEEFLGFRQFDKKRDRALKYLKSRETELKAETNKVENLNIRLKELENKLEVLNAKADTDQAKTDAHVMSLNDSIKDFEKKKRNLIKSGQQTVQGLGYKTFDEYSKGLSNTERKITQLSSAIKSKEKTLTTRNCPTCGQDMPEEHFSGLEEEILDLKSKLKEMSSSYSVLLSHKSNLEEIKADIRDLNTKIKFCNEEILKTKHEYKETDYSLERANLEAEKVKVAREITESDLMTFSRAYNNTKYIADQLKPSSEFRSFVLESYLGTINEFIEYVRPSIFNSLESLGFEADGNGVRLKIVMDGTDRVYRSFSGGERRRIDVMMSLAIQKFLYQMSGVKSNLLVFDEIFDNLDASGVNDVMNCITDLFKESNSIYIISHNHELKSYFNSVITVSKTKTTSKMEYVG